MMSWPKLIAAVMINGDDLCRMFIIVGLRKWKGIPMEKVTEGKNSTTQLVIF